MSGRLVVEARGPVVVATIDHEAKLNVLTLAILDDLSSLLARLERDSSVRALVLTGAGARAFSVGADIAAWGDMPPFTFARDWIQAGHRLFDRLARVPMPVIAALNGLVLGGGLELAASCDVRIAAGSSAFGLPEASIGVTAGWSGAQRLSRLMPEPLLREMALTGARLSAERMHAVGFVNELCDQPLARALEIADRTTGLAPRAVEITKLVLNAEAGEGRQAAIDALAGGFVASTRDRTEGVASFRQKRKPKFEGE